MFERINEADICAVETFVREDLLDIISTKAENSADEAVVEHQQLIDNFGELYTLNPSKFRFQPGDKKFIQLVIDHIRSEILKKGRKRALRHFGYTTEPQKKIKLTIDESLKEDNDTFSDSALKTKLFNQILQKLKVFSVPESILNFFNETFIIVNISENNTITGDVTCVVCHAQNKRSTKIKPKKVYCRTKSGIKSWIISNFETHLKRAHSNIQIPTEQELVELNIQASNSILNESIENNNYVEINQSVNNFSNGSLELFHDFDKDKSTLTEKFFNNQIANHMIKMWNVAIINGECLETVKCRDLESRFLIPLYVLML